MRSALVIGHPGHELRVYRWLELARPHVFVLTDGSGRSGRSRLDSTAKLLTQVGAEPGRIYGRLTDLALYSAILNRDFDLFIGLAEELAETFLHGQFDCVAGDAAEGYNPAHDVCRLIINSAVEIANRVSGCEIANFDFLLVGRPNACSEPLLPKVTWLELEEDAFARKLAAAQAYSELEAEIAAGVTRMGTNAFRVECLRPVTDRAGSYSLAEDPPFYERYGEKQVAAGHYQRVIRYREHVFPLAEALERYLTEKD